MMNGLLARASRRFYLRHPWQLALAVAGIGLGVAVYVGVALANDSARRAFDLSSEAVIGRTTHRLLPVGGALPEAVYAELVTQRGVTEAAPMIEAELRLRGRPSRRFILLGIDPVKEAEVRGFAGFVPESTSDVGRLMTEAGSVLLPDTLAEELDAAPGSRLEVLVGGRPRSVTVIGTLRAAAADAAAQLPIVADISTVQVLADKLGFIDRIDLKLDEDAAARLAADPPAGSTLVPAGSGGRGFDEVTQAFRTNLAALGLLALVVGMFLIYATMSFAIVQRRGVMGTLVAVGVDRRQLLASVLLEALVIGLAATTLGLVLGHVLAQGLVGLVLRTIGDLYYSAELSAVPPSPRIYVTGAALGLGATLIAALGPAIDAARSAPEATMRRAALERRTRLRTRWAAQLCVPVLLIGGLLLIVDTRSLYLAFGALFFVLAAGALLTPGATAWLMHGIEPAAERGFGLPGLLAVRGVTASLSRTGVATAALAVAVATVIGVGLMISSFRSSLIDWLDATLTADLYVSFDGGNDVEANVLAAIEAVPGVTGLSLSQYAVLPTSQGPIGLRAATPGPEGWGLDVVAGDVDALADHGDRAPVAVSEPFAFRRRLSVGDDLTLPTPAGPAAFPVVAVFRDYNAGGSTVLLPLERYRRIWNDTALSGVGVHLADGVDAEQARAAIGALLPVSLGARVRSTAGLIDISLAIFDRTFKITEVLRIVAALIAFLGVLSALLSIELEKTRELAVLKALGFAPAELGRLVLTQTTLLGLAAGLAAMAIGSVLAALLVHVINRRSFGWSMDLVIAPGPLVSGFALAVGAAVLAGLYPAFRAARAPLAGALREE